MDTEPDDDFFEDESDYDFDIVVPDNDDSLDESDGCPFTETCSSYQLGTCIGIFCSTHPGSF
jgi:hypothetical protein